MNELKNAMNQFTSDQRRIIALVIAALGTLIGLLGPVVKIDDDYQWVYDRMGIKGLEDGSISLPNFMQLYIEVESMGDVVATIFMMVLFLAGMALAVFGVLSGNKLLPIGLIPVAGMNMVFAIAIAILINDNAGFTVVSFSITRVFPVILSILASGFWFIACEADDVGETPESQQRAMEEIGKMANQVKAKAEEVKKANSCPSCGKLLTPKSQFCNGCGKPVPQANNACTGCNATLAKGAQFCPKCGTPRPTQ